MVGGIRPSAGVVLPLLPPALLHYTINRRKLQAVRQKICAKKAEMLGGVPCAALARPAAVENSMGGLPRRCRRGGRQRYPAGACPVGRPPTLPLACFPAPYPPSPLPQRGRGCPKVYFAGGFAPRTPAVNRLRLLQSLPSRYPAAEIRDLPQKRQEAVPYEQCRQPRRGGTGGEELRRLRWSSPPGQGKQVPRGFSPCGHHSGRVPLSPAGTLRNPPCNHNGFRNPPCNHHGNVVK